MAQFASLSSCASTVSMLDASLVPVHVDVVSGYGMHRKPSVSQIREMSPIPEEPHRGILGTVEVEVQDLWKVVKDMQKKQEDMLQSFQKTLGNQRVIEGRLDAFDTEMVEIRQKVFSVQELKVTDALDYAEAEVQDLRASLEKVHERQEKDAARVQQQQILLREQMKQLKNLQTSHEQQCTEVQNILQQRTKAFSTPKFGDLSPGDDFGDLSPGGIYALRAEVDMLETQLAVDLEAKLVVEQSRMVRKERENEYALKTLQSRIDTCEGQQKCALSLGAKDLLDLQAIVNRQLMEEHSETVARHGQLRPHASLTASNASLRAY